ncbi:MAG: proline--tRNA ligase, partial [Alphaproteobacteria bacterium]|nr:proline--tRNA ligase [Alphaproteobacteria bacterium]
MTEAAKSNKAPRTAITPTREENFSEWYQNVIKAAEMAENAPVRGCMVIRPYGYAVWENIQKHLDAMIKAEGVENAYFPLLIPLSFIAKEAKHIDGFAKECAVVTHHRLEANDDGELVPAGELTEPMIIRPTSETIIGDVYSRWVQSYRDLPLKINQWANVMRWEMRPRIFLRTSEFLWQEGHNVFETHDQAEADARRMIEVYREFYEDYMAVPGYVGAKTPDERFPGAIETYTIEAFMQDGKALQGCTSHNLGQTFSKSADIKFLDR